MADSVVAPPSRPIGLMVAILIVDLGLAAAGAVMLGKGLSAKKAKQADKVEQKDGPTDAKPVQKSEVTQPAPPAPTMQPASASPPSLVGAAAADPAKPEPVAAEPAKTVEAKAAKTSGTRGKDKDRKTLHASTTDSSKPTGPVTHPSASPEDPYGDAQVVFDLNTETSKLAAASNASFSRCDNGAVHGSVKIAFQVLPDGSVQHAMAVENTTNDPTLAQCLATVISTWRYTAHAGAVVNFMRPFNYP